MMLLHDQKSRQSVSFRNQPLRFTLHLSLDDSGAPSGNEKLTSDRLTSSPTIG